MNSQMLMYLWIGVGALFGIILVAYFILQKNNKEAKISNSKENITKTTKKATHTVNNYQELYNKIEEIKKKVGKIWY